MTETDNSFQLPRVSYGPLCLHILTEFIKHHHLSSFLPLPEPDQPIHKSMERIFDIMLRSMGKKRRDELLEDAREYLNSLPPSLRS